MDNQNERTVARSQIEPNYTLLKYILLGAITFGIYTLIWHVRISSDLNAIASKYDSKKTMNGALAYFLGIFTFMIVPTIWEHNICDRMGGELKRRNLDQKISSADYWLWGILGCFILVGPFVYIHKKCAAINALAADYNVNG